MDVYRFFLDKRKSLKRTFFRAFHNATPLSFNLQSHLKLKTNNHDNWLKNKILFNVKICHKNGQKTQNLYFKNT